MFESTRPHVTHSEQQYLKCKQLCGKLPGSLGLEGLRAQTTVCTQIHLLQVRTVLNNTKLKYVLLADFRQRNPEFRSWTDQCKRFLETSLDQLGKRFSSQSALAHAERDWVQTILKFRQGLWPRACRGPHESNRLIWLMNRYLITYM